jgi:hypothetical protein
MALSSLANHLAKESSDDNAKYWEAQASMWHEKYRDALRHEDDAKRYRDALLRIKDLSYGTKERLRLIVTRALQVDGES